MKKYLVILLGAVFILCFAASAFAIHAEIPAETQAVVTKGVQVTIDGDIRIRGEFAQNVNTFDDNAGDHTSFYDERIRLGVNAQVTPNTVGYIEIEGANGTTSTAYTWGSPDSGSKGVYFYGDAKRAQLNLLEAWILHTGSGLLGMPAGIKVGHMALALGNKLFFDHTLFGDDAIVLFADPMKELHIAVLTAKFLEGDPLKNDDSNAYVGLFSYTTKEFGISGDATYVDHQQTFLKGVAFPAAGIFGPPLGTGFPGGANAHLWNFGLRGNVDVAGLSLKADGEIQTGKVTDVPGGGPDIKFQGYAFLVGAAYTFAPVRLGVDYAYGSGDKGDDPSKFKTFVTSLSNYQHTTFVYDYISKWHAANFLGDSLSGGGVANTQYIKVDASMPLVKDLSGYLAYYWLRANELNCFQTGTCGGGPGNGANHDIGSEIDAKITYKIDKNLVYYVEGGYLFAGDFFKSVTGGNSPDDAYAVRHGIQLSF